MPTSISVRPDRSHRDRGRLGERRLLAGERGAEHALRDDLDRRGRAP